MTENNNITHNTNSMGRNTLCTPELTEDICKILATDMSIESACEYVGIALKTYYNWIDKGEKGQEPYLHFLQAVKEARAKGKANIHMKILKAADESWQAGAWILERRHPEEYGRRDNLEISGPGGGPIPVISLTPEMLARLTKDELKTLAAAQEILRLKAAEAEAETIDVEAEDVK